MKILLIYHRNPFSHPPRGAENSMRAIIDFLSNRNHEIILASEPTPSHLDVDIVLTWGNPAGKAADWAIKNNIKLVTMVRFWRNICPLPAGDLMKRPIDKGFTGSREFIFNHSSAIITNNEYSRHVIRRWQPVSKGKVKVCYVPILGKMIARPFHRGFITIVTPEIYGEKTLIDNLAASMPEEKFLLINADKWAKAAWGSNRPKNVHIRSYMPMSTVWDMTKLLLVPVYHNDICGTRRVTIEAFRNGVPVVAHDRCGMSEKVPTAMLVKAKANPKQWAEKINEINTNYERFQNIALSAWLNYDTFSELLKFEEILIDVHNEG